MTFIACEQWQPSIQQNIPPNYYNLSYQQQQQTHHRIINGQTNGNLPLFKLYDSDGNNKNEIIRLILSYAGVSFKDKRVKQEEWERVKDRIPIQRLPILRVHDQLKIYYLNAIVRYLAREFHLYGTGNEDHAIVDMIFELNREFQEKLFEQINHLTNIEQRKIILTQFITDHTINYLDQLEKLYNIFNRTGPFYLGSQISLADLIVYQTINYFIDIDPKLLDNYSHLQQARHHLEKHPQLTNYVNKKKFKTSKKRHASVPPIVRHNHHQHRHRSHDEHKSSHRHHSKESILSLQTKQEPKSPSIQSIEKESTPSLQIRQELKPPSIQSIEKESTPSLQIRQDQKPPSIQSIENESTPSLQIRQEQNPPSIQSIENESTPSLQIRQESKPPSIQSIEKESTPSLQIRQEPKPPSIQSIEKESTSSLQIRQEQNPPSIQSIENESTPSLQIRQEQNPPSIQSIENESTPSLQIRQELKPPRSQSIEKESTLSLEIKQEPKLPNVQTEENKLIPPQSTEIISPPPPAPVVAEEKYEPIVN
jgi:glutathione S-transferase